MSTLVLKNQRLGKLKQRLFRTLHILNINQGSIYQYYRTHQGVHQTGLNRSVKNVHIFVYGLIQFNPVRCTL